MRGYPENNVNAFIAAEVMLESEGFIPVNPVRADLEDGIDPTKPLADGSLHDIIIRDIQMLLTCEYIYLLDGWTDSSGANAEWSTAKWAGIKRLVFKQQWEKNNED
jgi:hypothetical protein